MVIVDVLVDTELITLVMVDTARLMVLMRPYIDGWCFCLMSLGSGTYIVNGRSAHGFPPQEAGPMYWWVWVPGLSAGGPSLTVLALQHRADAGRHAGVVPGPLSRA